MKSLDIFEALHFFSRIFQGILRKEVLMYNVFEYFYCKMKAKYFLMRANRIKKYYESLPLRKLSLHYELKAHSIKNLK